MKLSITHIATNENIEVHCHPIVGKAVQKMAKNTFKVVKLQVYDPPKPNINYFDILQAFLTKFDMAF